jgi:hypothetical protein
MKLFSNNFVDRYLGMMYSFKWLFFVYYTVKRNLPEDRAGVPRLTYVAIQHPYPA